MDYSVKNEETHKYVMYSTNKPFMHLHRILTVQSAKLDTLCFTENSCLRTTVEETQAKSNPIYIYLLKNNYSVKFRQMPADVLERGFHNI